MPTDDAGETGLVSKITKVAGCVWTPLGDPRQARQTRFSGPMTIENFSDTLRGAIASIGESEVLVHQNCCWWDASQSNEAGTAWLPIQVLKGADHAGDR